MQETRQHILLSLKKRTSATVDQLVEDLAAVRGTLTHVTVRHHLARLQEDGLITSQTEGRVTPGRPHLIYMLTEHGLQSFPNNFQHLFEEVLNQIEQTLPVATSNVIFEGVARTMAADAAITGVTMAERLAQVTNYLNNHGYEAGWESLADGYLLHTHNCPYHRERAGDNVLCRMDMKLISSLLGVVPRLASHMAEGDDSCSYFIPDKVFLQP